MVAAAFRRPPFGLSSDSSGPCPTTDASITLGGRDRQAQHVKTRKLPIAISQAGRKTTSGSRAVQIRVVRLFLTAIGFEGVSQKYSGAQEAKHGCGCNHRRLSIHS